MSGGKLRNETDCLNCGHHVGERFCPHCGQENLEPKENFFQLVFHTFADITHFDSKFFTTLKYLFFRPGKLTSEYNIGRRASYVHPIKLFVFTSFIFFMGLSILQNPHKLIDEINDKIKSEDSSKTNTSFPDTIIQISFNGIDTIIKDSTKKDYLTLNIDSTKLSEGSFIAEHLSHLDKIYKKDKIAFWKNALTSFIHNAHYFILVFIPILAFLYFLMYWRRKFFFSEHIIYAIHFHVIILIILLLNMILGKILSISIFEYLFFGIIVYQFISMKTVYKQGYGKTLVKLLLIDIIYFILLLILLSMLFLYSMLMQH